MFHQILFQILFVYDKLFFADFAHLFAQQFWDSSPDREQSFIEWEDIPYTHPSGG